MAALLTVSLIATVRNEREQLVSWLDGISCQTRLPDEFVIVDGGSTDGTWEALRAWKSPCPVRLLRVSGASISAGRNIAMSQAVGDVFAITDCGTVAEPGWLESLVGPFDDPSVDAVSGFFVPEHDTVWQRALLAATIPDISEIRPDRFLPSGRSVAVRSAWVRHGFEYPEWLDYCEDLIWDMRMKEAGARFRFQPAARVRFAGRPDIPSFWRQYYRYARGDGKAGLFGKRHGVRYLTYAVTGIVAVRRNPIELAVGTGLAVAYVSTPMFRLWGRDRRAGRPVVDTATAATLIPVVRLIGDLAKMAGYPAGLLWRWQRYRTLVPWKNWRRIRTDGEMWQPALHGEALRQPED